jgi:hypothetical protein
MSHAGLAAIKAFQGSWSPSPPVEDLLRCVDDALAMTPAGTQIASPYARAQWEDWRITLTAQEVSRDLESSATGLTSHFEGYRFAARSRYRQDPGRAATMEFECFAVTDGEEGNLQLFFHDSGFPPFFIEASEFLVDATLRIIASTLRERIFGMGFPQVLEMQRQGAGWFHHRFNFPRVY